jgi:HPt (histidine-containing phosphotransfer) domain-containing protein
MSPSKKIQCRNGEQTMASEFITALESIGADVKSALSRMLNKEEMYKKFLRKFREDTNILSLKELIESNETLSAQDSEKVFHYAHTIKGVTGNLGLTDLYNESSYICEATRNETADMTNIKAHFNMLWADYEKLLAALQNVL